jgi:uncharacterized protein (TIGR00255 family)
MTGFGAAEARGEQWVLQAEARSVNHRDLRVSFRLPDAFQMKEFELQKIVEERIRRGHLYFSLVCRPLTGQSPMLVDQDRLKGYLAALRRVAEAEQMPLNVDLSVLLRLPGALRDATTDAELGEGLWPLVRQAAGEALDALVAMREAEGANLRGQLQELAGAIEGMVGEIEREQGAFVEAYRERLCERVAKLLQGTDVPVDEDSLAREVAFQADRSDVSEEIERLRSHLEQLREALDGEENPVGRKLEFLGQEMLREAGTIAAKAPAGPQVRLALELKSQVEKLREQVRNVE